MQTKDYSITLDMIRTLPFRPFEVVEGDTGNVLHVTLLNDGDPVALDGCNIQIAFASSIGFAIQDETQRNSENSAGGHVRPDALPHRLWRGQRQRGREVYSGTDAKTLITSTRLRFSLPQVAHQRGHHSRKHRLSPAGRGRPLAWQTKRLPARSPPPRALTRTLANSTVRRTGTAGRHAGCVHPQQADNPRRRGQRRRSVDARDASRGKRRGRRIARFHSGGGKVHAGNGNSQPEQLVQQHLYADRDGRRRARSRHGGHRLGSTARPFGNRRGNRSPAGGKPLGWRTKRRQHYAPRKRRSAND